MEKPQNAAPSLTLGSLRQVIASDAYAMSFQNMAQYRCALLKLLPPGSGLQEDAAAPKFTKTYCSQCGAEFGPGNHGYSRCEDHCHKQLLKNQGEK